MPTLMVIDHDLERMVQSKQEFDAWGWYVAPITVNEEIIRAVYRFKPDTILIHSSIVEDDRTKHTIYTLMNKLRDIRIPFSIQLDNPGTSSTSFYRLGAEVVFLKKEQISTVHNRLLSIVRKEKLNEPIILIDPFTKLPNERFLKHFNETLEALYNGYTEGSYLVYIDIDRIKVVNDAFGYDYGDEVIQWLSQLLKEHARKEDLLIRIKGEEFALLLPKTTKHQVIKRIRWLQTIFSEHPFLAEGKTFYSSFSATVVKMDHSTKSLLDWITFAHETMYEQEQDETQTATLLHSSDDGKFIQEMKVAIVDDDPIIRTILTDILNNLPRDPGIQFDIMAFPDGLTFIESPWHNDSPCLVILDGVMPKMDGLEVLEQLRKREDSDRYQVLMLSSRRSDKDIALSLSLGANDYMTKPFKLLELEARLQQLIKRMV
ncbi:diguanylate cyclase [Bacillus coahuilensis]|uniref:GGDEF domain-containing response regulator n=1 Tax=Bacillus coahuilensis TaxID=408580 RepID=UPI0003044AA8|nr:diguanylate cyclase [Bacillus coahuilensis]